MKWGPWRGAAMGTAPDNDGNMFSIQANVLSHVSKRDCQTARYHGKFPWYFIRPVAAAKHETRGPMVFYSFSRTASTRNSRICLCRNFPVTKTLNAAHSEYYPACGTEMGAMARGTYGQAPDMNPQTNCARICTMQPPPPAPSRLQVNACPAR